MVDAVSNTPELSVSELSGALKRTVEDAFGHVRLRGELSGYRGPHSSGHVYFSIKDAGAKIDAVIWKGVFSRIKFRPEDGLEVIATGRITTFPGKSSYQIVVEAMEPAGVGALLAQLEERRKKLAAEGLFDAARKKRLPFLPEVIGIVTSPTGAVIRDILHRLSDRFPRQVLLWPVRVQGEGSAEEVAAAIRGFDAIGPDDDLPRPDVLIVARGGGSIEDLWSFNEEIVLRAVAECSIPLISAVGHETDTTLIDYVSDMRAPTPTAAAEMAVPVRAELLADIRERASRLAGASVRLGERRRRDLAALTRALPPPERALEAPRQRLDRAVMRAQSLMRARLDAQHRTLATLARKLGAQTPEARLARQREKLDQLGARLPLLKDFRLRLGRQALQPLTHRLKRAMEGRVALEKRDTQRRRGEVAGFEKRLRLAIETRRKRERQRVESTSKLLESFSYRKVLARGYAVVWQGDGIVSQAASLKPDAPVTIEFADGRIPLASSGEGGITAPPVAAPVGAIRPVKPKPQGGGQGSLF